MGSVVPPAAMATAAGFVAVSANILAFLSSYYMGFIGSVFTEDPIRSAFISSVIIFVVMGFAFLFVKGKQQPAAEDLPEESL
jgi:FtsH-binding integral membrane protein